MPCLDQAEVSLSSPSFSIATVSSSNITGSTLNTIPVGEGAFSIAESLMMGDKSNTLVMNTCNSSHDESIVDLIDNFSNDEIDEDGEKDAFTQQETQEMKSDDLRLILSRKGKMPYLSTADYSRQRLEDTVLNLNKLNVPQNIANEAANFEMIEPEVFDSLNITELLFQLERRGIQSTSRNKDDLRKELRTALKNFTLIIENKKISDVIQQISNDDFDDLPECTKHYSSGSSSSNEEIVELSRDQLRKKCKEKNLKVKGNCAELINRLTINAKKRKGTEELTTEDQIGSELSSDSENNHACVSEDENNYMMIEDDDSIIEEDINEKGDVIPSESGKFILIEEDVLIKLKVDDLKDELKKRGIPMSGKKAELQLRLKEAMANKVTIVEEERATGAGTGFAPNARWYLLEREEEPVPLPENEISFYVPTDTDK